MLKPLLTLPLVALLASQLQAAPAAKSDTLVVTTTPVMHCKNCENRIKTNIRFVKGTKQIQTSVPNQTVTIIYDGQKATYADYEAAFRKIGFQIQKPVKK